MLGSWSKGPHTDTRHSPDQHDAQKNKNFRKISRKTSTNRHAANIIIIIFIYFFRFFLLLLLLLFISLFLFFIIIIM